MVTALQKQYILTTVETTEAKKTITKTFFKLMELGWHLKAFKGYEGGISIGKIVNKADDSNNKNNVASTTVCTPKIINCCVVFVRTFSRRCCRHRPRACTALNKDSVHRPLNLSSWALSHGSFMRSWNKWIATAMQRSGSVLRVEGAYVVAKWWEASASERVTD